MSRLRGATKAPTQIAPGLTLRVTLKYPQKTSQCTPSALQKSNTRTTPGSTPGNTSEMAWPQFSLPFTFYTSNFL